MNKFQNLSHYIENKIALIMITNNSNQVTDIYPEVIVLYYVSTQNIYGYAMYNDTAINS